MGKTGGHRMRDRLKDLEFHLPPAIQAVAIKPLGLVQNPYTAENDELRTIFIHVPKTAGSSITEAFFKRKPRHIPLSRYYAADAGRYGAYFKFGFVREPHARLYSAYNYLTRPGVLPTSPDFRWAAEHLARFESFEAFVLALEDPRFRRIATSYVHFRPQHHWMRVPGVAANGLDFLGRFESLEADAETLRGRFAVHGALPHKRKAVTGAAASLPFSRKMTAIVADLYGEDFRLFGYDPALANTSG